MANMLKVKLGEVSPNPFRNFELNPIDPAHIAGLKDSIKEHGFWTGVQVRKDPDGPGFQLVFGHRRFMAATDVLGPDTQVDVEFVEADDIQMVRRLFDENFHQGGYASSLDVQEAVEAARDMLIEQMQKFYRNPIRLLAPVSKKDRSETWREEFMQGLEEEGLKTYFCEKDDGKGAYLEGHLLRFHRIDPGPVAVARLILGDSYRAGSHQYQQIAAAYEVLPRHPQSRDLAGADGGPDLEALKHGVRDLPRQSHVSTAFSTVKKVAEGKDARAEAARKPEVQKKIAERIKSDLEVFTSKSQRVKVSPDSGVKTTNSWTNQKPEARMTTKNIERVVEEVIEEEIGGNKENVRLRSKAEALRRRVEDAEKLVAELEKEWSDLSTMLEDPGVKGLWHAIRRLWEKTSVLASLARVTEVRERITDESNVIVINSKPS